MSNISPELKIKRSMSLVRKPKQLKFQQRMMIKFLVAGLPLNEIAPRINVSIQRCQKWLRSDKVAKELELQTGSRAELDIKKRRQRSEYIATELFQALAEKIANGSLEKMNTKTLMKFMVEFNKEIRNDTPGESNKVVHHKVEFTEELTKRYLSANSAKFDDKREQIIDITIPKQIETPKGETLNESEIIQSPITQSDQSQSTESNGGERIQSDNVGATGESNNDGEGRKSKYERKGRTKYSEV